MKVEENIFLSLLCFALFVEGIYKIFMINKSRFSSNRIYYFMSYIGVLWVISMYISTYYLEDMNRDNFKFFGGEKFSKYLRVFLLLLILFLIFAAIRAKYLGYY